MLCPKIYKHLSHFCTHIKYAVHQTNLDDKNGGLGQIIFSGPLMSTHQDQLSPPKHDSPNSIPSKRGQVRQNSDFLLKNQTFGAKVMPKRVYI